MDVLKLLAAPALLAAACYEPRWQDCAVRCSSTEDCAPGQMCGAHGYCAAPDQACTTGVAPAIDAPRPDAHPPDGATEVQLRVRVTDGGRVVVKDVGMCDSEDLLGGDCRFSVSWGVQLELRALPHEEYIFEKWTSDACAMAGALCPFTPVAPMTEVRARFIREDDGHIEGM